jgi:hypothetical protein
MYLWQSSPQQMAPPLFLSVVHFGFGILSYYVFAPLDDKRSPDEDLLDDSGNINWSKGLLTDENLGLFITLYLAAAFESVENSKPLVDRFRTNSGQGPIL